ncbi:MAG: PspC domain-containing protein [Chloroflexi bacterium]|nr:PspC domain-containing protein [Chloroflexota bacterium]
MNQRLFRSRDDRVIAGVAGGLAAMLNVDPSLVRILWVILVPLTGGFIILLYFVMAIVVPEMPIAEDRWQAWERPWPDPWTDHGSMGSTGETGIPSPSSDTDSPPALGGTGGTGAVGEPGVVTSDEATRRVPPAGTLAGAGAGSSPGGWQPPLEHRGSAWQTPGEESRDRGVPLIFGLILVLIGAFFLARTYVPGIDWEALWPFLLIGTGIALLLGSLRRSTNRS